MQFPWLVLGALGSAGIAGILARTTRQYALAAVLAGGAILYLHGWLYFHYTADDAYISYRYARNLADGGGLVWNPGQHVEGYSNFLWVMILAGMRYAGGDIMLSGRWLGFGLGIVALAETYLLARALSGGDGGSVAGLVAVLILGVSGPFAVWTFAGLEIPLFAALTLGAVLLHLHEQDGFRPPLSGAAWALAAMTRPDGVLLVAVSGLFKLGEFVALFRAPDSRTRGRIEHELGWLLVWALGFAVIYVPYFVWRYETYGWFYPNTYYAKVGAALDQYERGLAYLGTFSREYAAWLLLLPPLAIALLPAMRAPRAYATALVLAWFAYVVYVGGDSLARFRFFAPLMPLFCAAVAASGGALVAAVAAQYRGRRWAMDGVLVVAVAALLAFMLEASAADFGLPVERQAVTDRAEIGRWLRANVPDSTVIAVIPAGAIPYESRLVTIDMLGINDEHIAHRHLQLGKFAAGHEKYDTEYVLERRPDIIIGKDTLTDSAMARADYTPLAGGVIPARIDLLHSPRLWAEYEPRAVEVREGKWFNLLVRRDAEAVLVKTEDPAPSR